MHELSIAVSLLDELEAAAARQGATNIASVRLRVGRLSGVARDALLFAWDLARAGTIAANAKLHIEDVEVSIYCNGCLRERAPRPGEGFTCDACGCVAAHVVRGRELELVAMEIVA